eukprot:5123800-Karenia_brevis.AAC.1
MLSSTYHWPHCPDAVHDCDIALSLHERPKDTFHRLRPRINIVDVVDALGSDIIRQPASYGNSVGR